MEIILPDLSTGQRKVRVDGTPRTIDGNKKELSTRQTACRACASVKQGLMKKGASVTYPPYKYIIFDCISCREYSWLRSRLGLLNFLGARENFLRNRGEGNPPEDYNEKKNDVVFFLLSEMPPD